MTAAKFCARYILRNVKKNPEYCAGCSKKKLFDSICVQVFSSLEEEKNKIEEKLRQVLHSNPLFYFTNFTNFTILLHLSVWGIQQLLKEMIF